MTTATKEKANVERKDSFNQVCVWPGTTLGDSTVEQFEKFFMDELNTRIQFLEIIETAPDMENGMPVEGTGGRSDILFAVHKDDIGHFAIKRLAYEIRWIEDVYGNGSLYPERIAEYKTWDAGGLEDAEAEDAED